MAKRISIGSMNVPRGTFCIPNLALAALCWSMVGCATLGSSCSLDGGGGLAEKGKRAAVSAADNAAHLGGLAPIALGFVALGGLALVASFVPIASTFVPRKAAGASVIFGLGLYYGSGFVSGFMAKFGDVVYWAFFIALIAVGVCAIWPWLAALHEWAKRRMLNQTSKVLQEAGHLDAAAAFKITATPGASKSRDIRKAILANMKGNPA